MSFMKCFDAASIVIEDANERFSPLWKTNEERLNIFKRYCEAIDLLSDEFDGESFEIEVDEITMGISVTLECDEIVIESKEHILYELAKGAVRCGFSATGEGTLLVRFVFPSIWNKV